MIRKYKVSFLDKKEKEIKNIIIKANNIYEVDDYIDKILEEKKDWKAVYIARIGFSDET